METSRKIKYSRIDRLILGIAYALLSLFVLSIVIPLIYVVLASFMDPTVLNNQGLSFRIKDWTLDAYRRVLENEMIWRGFFNSFFYSLAFTAISVFITLLAAYPMSKKEFVGRNFFNVIPVCKPIIAVLALWSFVGMWNSYFDALIYLNDADLQPLQLVLRSILVQNTPQPGMIADIQSTAEMAKVAEQLKYATIVVSSLPLLIMYPFFQKYFDKGIMVGSVKG